MQGLACENLSLLHCVFYFLCIAISIRPNRYRSPEMELSEDIVIIGAGIAGLATSLGLHRMGLKSLVLESSDNLRASGFTLLTWMNAWKAFDVLGIGNSLRQHSLQLQGLVTSSTVIGSPTSRVSFLAEGKCGNHEVRCVRRNMLVEALAKELPNGAIRFGSKVVSIEQSGNFKLVHLADGRVLKTKILIGCDGVNSMVAKWLGLQKPTFTGRFAARGFAEFPNGHGFKPDYLLYHGDSFRYGVLPCDEKNMYWFITYTPSPKSKDAKESPAELKQLLQKMLAKVPVEMSHVVERTRLDTIIVSPLRARRPWELLRADICKNNVCVAGDALHPMTPDLGQGGCSAVEDGITLARCIGEALLGQSKGIIEEKDEFARISIALNKYAKERKWRGIDLITTGYIVGSIQESSGMVLHFLRDKLLAGWLTGTLLKKADFDCGMLYSSL